MVIIVTGMRKYTIGQYFFVLINYPMNVSFYSKNKSTVQNASAIF
jgi:hypothetical protein